MTFSFFPTVLDQSLIYFRSTFSENSLRSVQTFISEFFPPLKPGEILNVYTGTNEFEPLDSPYSYCDYLQTQHDIFVSSDFYKQRKSESQLLYSNIFQQLNITQGTNDWLSLGNWLSSFSCYQQKLNLSFDDSILNRTLEDAAFDSATFFETLEPGAAGSIPWYLVLSNIEKTVNSTSKTKFYLYFSTAETIEAFLYFIGWKTDVLPPLASPLAIEVWENEKESYVRLVLNGDVVQFQGSDLTLFDHFAKFTRGFYSFCVK
uniref:Histidine acid phosphatase n=1 Tax=Coptotermes formosanus TaxID=36987 RepID=R4UP73_COPFO|nr:histidine acid phosphatase [Coptotermes formosanus]